MNKVESSVHKMKTVATHVCHIPGDIGGSIHLEHLSYIDASSTRVGERMANCESRGRTCARARAVSRWVAPYDA